MAGIIHLYNNMSNRKSIYYWKCDRPSAFGTLNTDGISDDDILSIRQSLMQLLTRHFNSPDFNLLPGGGQGNHLTFKAESKAGTYFIKVENGPEHDNYMEVEAHVLDLVRETGVPTPEVYKVDSSRKEVPYSYQFLQYFNDSDLNRLNKTGNINLIHIAREIGRNIARWQSVQPKGFGPFDPEVLKKTGILKGFHDSYTSYFHLNLDKHLLFLTSNGILSETECEEIQQVVQANQYLLDNLEKGCLVHKDLALWNILGTRNEIKAFIDWDDTVSGDPTDDLSLLACFHSEAILDAAINGYAAVRTLPQNFFPRFWLHLLRNMIVKAVIRVGGGYFDRTSEFFLIGSKDSGMSLKEITRQRIYAAIEGLAANKEELQL